MAADRLVENRQRLIQFLNAEVDSLTGILRVYLLRAGLGGGEDAVGELVNSVVVEALTHAERYNPDRPSRAWLLGIAANLVRRRQAEAARLNLREPLASDLVKDESGLLGEDELFDLLAAHPLGKDPREELEERDSLSAALALLSAEERSIIRLFSSRDLNGEAMAAALQVSPGAARVRLHRALAHLRRVWHLTEEKTQ